MSPSPAPCSTGPNGRRGSSRETTTSSRRASARYCGTWSTGSTSLATALAGGGVALFAHVVYRFAAQSHWSAIRRPRPGVDRMVLLVFIVTELVHIVRAILDNKV